MGMVGTRTFGRLGNFSWKEQAVRSHTSGSFKDWRSRRLHGLANYGLGANLPAACVL